MLEISKISKSFGAVKALNNINLEIENGEFFSLLGPSGCGKTTLLRIISGFEQPDHGKITLDEKDITDIKPYNRPTNLLFQSYALFPHLSVIQNISYGLQRENLSHIEIDKKVNAIIEKTSLNGLQDRRPNELSGGQKQRVALARCLVKEPKILLLDEPLSALDKSLKEKMKIELKKIQKDFKTTFIMVTHDQDEALVLADKIAVMNDGEVIQIDSPKELYSNPKNYFVANFRAIANLATKNETAFNFNEVFNNMFTLNNPLSLNDWFLFLIGFIAAIIAFVTSYKMDDPYPGYGKIHRQLEEAREEYNNTKTKIEEELDKIQKSQIREVSKLSDDLTVNHNISKSIIADEESYLSKLQNSHGYLEKACNVCLREYQQNNESARTKSKPKYFNKSFKFDDNFTLANNVKNNKEILKKTSRYVDQIGSHLTNAKSEITSNYESAIDRFRVIEKKNKLI